jgi:hypothetical protein
MPLRVMKTHKKKEEETDYKKSCADVFQADSLLQISTLLKKSTKC